MEFLLDINLWSAFLTLTILEIVPGIDTVITAIGWVADVSGGKR